MIQKCWICDILEVYIPQKCVCLYIYSIQKLPVMVHTYTHIHTHIIQTCTHTYTYVIYVATYTCTCTHMHTRAKLWCTMTIVMIVWFVWIYSITHYQFINTRYTINTMIKCKGARKCPWSCVQITFYFILLTFCQPNREVSHKYPKNYYKILFKYLICLLSYS